MTRIVLAFDSFKGSLRSSEVAEAFALGIRDVVPAFEVRTVMLADGGEGTVEALAKALHAEYVELCVSDPLGRPVVARYAVAGDTAIVETAAASGLTLLSDGERNPLVTSTYGTGELVHDALSRGCRRVVLGLGGSATNDGGVGMLRALGFRFLDAEGGELMGRGDELERIATIDEAGVSAAVRDAEFIIASDVDNPMVGERGAAAVYAPQKGADASTVARLERGLSRFADILMRRTGVDVASLAGGGAAGGMGGGCHALLGARLVRGVELVLDGQRFDDIIADCDMVFTGEGRIDRQTLMGKAPQGVLARAQRQGIPVVAVGGSVAWCDELKTSAFEAIYSATDGSMPLAQAMQRDVAMANLRRVAQDIARKHLLR